MTAGDSFGVASHLVTSFHVFCMRLHFTQENVTSWVYHHEFNRSVRWMMFVVKIQIIYTMIALFSLVLISRCALYKYSCGFDGHIHTQTLKYFSIFNPQSNRCFSTIIAIRASCQMRQTNIFFLVRVFACFTLRNVDERLKRVCWYPDLEPVKRGPADVCLDPHWVWSRGSVRLWICRSPVSSDMYTHV